MKKAGISPFDVPFIYCTSAKIDQNIIDSNLEFQIVKCGYEQHVGLGESEGKPITDTTGCNSDSEIDAYFKDKVITTGVVS